MNRVFENPFELPGAFSHDGAAVLVRDGRVVAAVEEERLNRIKHSNKFPTEAIRYCLAEGGIGLDQVDRIAFYATEAYCNGLLDGIYLAEPALAHRLDARTLLRHLLHRELGVEVAPERIVFAGHHMAHVVSAFAMSGFERSLAFAVDGYGDHLSGMVAEARSDSDGAAVTVCETFSQSDSLGLFYLAVIRFIGYGPFDEYKVMGLAPYGDPAVYRELLAPFYELLPEGRYRLDLDAIPARVLARLEPRKKGQPFRRQDHDLAAALQEALERIVFHVLGHWRRVVGPTSLCLAGGVAHNCTMTGKLMYSGLFDDIFVQPAAHDAGCALGAALMASEKLGALAPRQRLTRVYWGTDAGGAEAIETELARWGPFLSWRRCESVTAEAARLLAGDAVIGWVQGRSEFGPRALGNRSIVADPRPAGNKDRVNAIIKKREGYRPFAPSVLAEVAHDYFDLPPGWTGFEFMNFVVDVLPEQRELLGAITHVDGTARLQTVSREDNPLYWELIRAFQELTGVGMVLNTSFNNHAEPIVDSIEDAVVTFLTTGLDYLVAGPFVVAKRPVADGAWLALRPALPPYVRLHETAAFVDRERMAVRREIGTSYKARLRRPVSDELYRILGRASDGASLGELLDQAAVPPERRAALVEELRELWTDRLVRLAPPAAVDAAAAHAAAASSGAVR